MFGSLGAPEIAIIAVVIILIFGVGKISGLGRELGSSIKEFRRAVKDEDKEEEPQQAKAQQAPPQEPPVQQAQTQQQAPPEQPAQPQPEPKEKSNIF